MGDVFSYVWFNRAFNWCIRFAQQVQKEKNKIKQVVFQKTQIENDLCFLFTIKKICGKMSIVISFGVKF